MPQKIIARLQDVGFTYPEADDPALSNISMEVREGEWIALLGSNGSGKSTLAKHLNALLIPTQGACFICGRDTREADYLWEIRSSVAMVFQNPENQIVASLVEDDTAFGPENQGLPQEEIRKRVRWSLRAVGLEDKADKPAYTLSGGQKQRLAIAGALAMDPPCLVLDEPTAMLDPQGRNEVLDVLKRLHQRGMAIVHITHRLEEVVSADRVMVLETGHCVWEGTPMDLFSRGDKLEQWGLEVPPMIRLWQGLRERKLLPEGTLPEIDEVVAALCPSL